MTVVVGDTIDWTLRGFHNRTGATATNYAVVDIPGVGLNFLSGTIPALHNGAGVTYSVRYRVAGSSVVHTHATGIPASAPFTFALPQPGDRHYTHIELYFGTVPADFALGDEIVFTFRVGNNAPNNLLVNHFVVMHNGAETPGQSPYQPVVLPPPPSNGPLVPNGNGNGYIELDDGGIPRGEWIWNDNQWVFTEIENDGVPLGIMPQTGIGSLPWLATMLSLIITGGMGTLLMILVRKRIKEGA